jgi:hypothetical protein
MNVIQDIPIILNSISVQDDYDGDFTTRRFVTHTLNFTLKLNLFSGNSTSGIITTVKANINDSVTNEPTANYTSVGDPTDGSITSESWLEHF